MSNRRLLLRQLRAIAHRENLPELISTNQAAGLAGVTSRTVRAWVATGGLLSTKPGRSKQAQLRIPREEFIKYLCRGAHSRITTEPTGAVGATILD